MTMTASVTLDAVLAACGPAPRRYPIEHKDGLLGSYWRYGPWKIRYDPPPIPVRNCDWHWVHDDFDAELVDGTWEGNGMGGCCASFPEALNECDEWEDENAPGAECEACDGDGNIWNNADPTSGQSVPCEECAPTPEPKP